MGWTVLIILVGAVVFAISIYNRLVAGRNRFKNAFAQIDVQLTRRHDLIPNLVETAKAYMKHERETLEAVITARNQAATAAGNAAANPADARCVSLNFGRPEIPHEGPVTCPRVLDGRRPGCGVLSDQVCWKQSHAEDDRGHGKNESHGWLQRSILIRNLTH